MITIKIKYESTQEFQALLSELRRQQSSLTRWSFNRHMEELNSTAIYRKSLELSNVCSDSWYRTCALQRGRGLALSHRALGVKKKPVFGGEKNWRDFLSGKITKEEWKQRRLLPFYVVGEAIKNGNRKFRLEPGVLTFKHSKDRHFDLQLGHISRKNEEILEAVTTGASAGKVPFSVSINETHVFFHTDPDHVRSFLEKTPTKRVATRVAGIDLNPNRIGLTIIDGKRVVHSRVFELVHEADRNEKLHELSHVCKKIERVARGYGVSRLVMEDLNINSKDHGKSKSFNKLVNQWNRNYVVSVIKRRCALEGVDFKTVNCAYSSFIGQINNPSLPDPCAAAQEIARRGLKNNRGRWAYPPTPDLSHWKKLWKQDSGVDGLGWVELYRLAKDSGLRYRAPIPDDWKRRKLSGMSSYQLLSG